MAPTANVRLGLLGTSANVGLVRRLLKGVVQALALSALEADALYTAVAEALKNVVHHAYDGVEGPLELELYAEGVHTEVLVRDQGIGIRPRLGERTQPHVGIGLPMIHALTRRVTYTNLDEGGTEVRMQFVTPGAVPLDPVVGRPPGVPDFLAPVLSEAPRSDQAPARPEGRGAGSQSVELALAPLALARHVLPGVLGALIEQAGFSAKEGAEPGALAALLAARSCAALSGDQLWLKAAIAARDLEVRICPLRSGCGEGVLDALRDALSPSLELSGGVSVLTGEPLQEGLALGLGEPLAST